MRDLRAQVRARYGRVSPSGALAFSRQAGLLTLALGLVNGSNFVFHLAVSRPLGPSNYGALAALLAVLMIVSGPFAVLQTVVTQRTAALGAQGRPSEVTAFAASAVSGVLPVAILAAVATLVVVAPLLSLFLDVTLL